nr:F-box domain protein [Pandoravirus massiliensis]
MASLVQDNVPEEEEARLGDWDSLPVELTVRILNGYSERHGNTRRKRARRPFLDPRWRFAARAVCRQWRAIIQQPTLAEASAMGKHPHKRCNSVHEAMPVGCPKWPAGRVVCLTAVAEWIASDPTPWVADPEALYTWCARTCGATRKHAVAALFASGQPWAVEQALGHYLPGLSFEVSLPLDDPKNNHNDARSNGNEDDVWTSIAALKGRSRADIASRVDMLCTARIYGDYDDWDKDGGGDAVGLIQVLLDASLYSGDMSGHDALSRRFDYVKDHSLILGLINHGRADLLEHAIRGGMHIDEYQWDAAAMSKNLACIHRLLALAAEGVLPLPDATQNGGQPLWINTSIRNGQVSTLTLCDHYGIAFDHVKAFSTAAVHRRPKVMAWLWHRQKVRQCEPPLDLDAVVDESLLCRSSRQTLSIEWMCTEGGWTPRPEALVGLVERACYNEAFECALFLIERWPRVFFDQASKHDVVRIFAFMARRRCVCHMVMRFVGMIDRHGAPSTLAGINLWRALFDTTIVDYGRTWRNWAYIICAIANGEMPSARNVCAISPPPRKPCACTFDPQWRHIIDNNGQRGTDLEGPCTPEQAAMFAPLARYARPEPIALPPPSLSSREVLTQGQSWHHDDYTPFYDFFKARGLIADSEATA